MSKTKGSDICAPLSIEQQHLLRERLARLLNKWSLWVLAELGEESPLRFSRLLERIAGVSQKSLSATLKSLERDGFLVRIVTVQVPIRVDYAITDRGTAFVRQVEPIWFWAMQNLLEP